MRSLSSGFAVLVFIYYNPTGYEDLIWIHKTPPYFPQCYENKQNRSPTKQPGPTVTAEKTPVAIETSNIHAQMKHNVRQAYKKQIGNASSESMELYFLLEIMFTIKENQDRRQLLESIWCQNSCFYERYTRFKAISADWAKEVI